jgi:ribonucleoside-diphosphate reductase alpha chain
METSTGIEPIFSWAYKRRYRHANVWKEQVVIDPLFKEFYSKGKDLSVFVGAYDIFPSEHLKVQAEIQKYIDSSISKTINLPKEARWEDLTETFLDHMQYLKGCTIYRAGSKGDEPLEAIPLNAESINTYMKSKDESIIEGVESAVACSLNGGNCGE